MPNGFPERFPEIAAVRPCRRSPNPSPGPPSRSTADASAAAACDGSRCRCAKKTPRSCARWRPSLADPGRAAEARALLRGRFAPAPARSLKDLLASAPLEGVDLDRPRDAGRAVEL
jgi:hypothetical protein